MWFVSALMIMISAVFLYEKVQRVSIEVAVGCIAVALLSLVIAIVIAPWQIQMLLLVGVILASSTTKADLLN